MNDRRACHRIVLLIKGIAGEENLSIEIKNGTPSVNETKENPDIVLEQMEAMNFFFAEFAPVRNGLAPEISGWFPLPIYIYPADDV